MPEKPLARSSRPSAIGGPSGSFLPRSAGAYPDIGCVAIRACCGGGPSLDKVMGWHRGKDKVPGLHHGQHGLLV
jgi:hypothetical protein